MNTPVSSLSDRFVPLTSLQNARVKNVVKLRSRRQRDEQQQTAVEGIREVKQALAAGLVPTEIFVCPEIVAAESDGGWLLDRCAHLVERGNTAVFTVTRDIFAKIAVRGSSGGILAVVPYFAKTLANLVLRRQPFIVIIVGGEKPGNIGAILRTADGAGVDALILCPEPNQPGTDIHNPNVVRASLGAVFTIPVVMAEAGELRAWLRQHQIQMAAATPAANQTHTAVDLRGPIALVLGSEAQGLSSSWLAAANTHVAIPMYGRIDSLNLSVSAALLMYEVVRQRQPQSEPC